MFRAYFAAPVGLLLVFSTLSAHAGYVTVADYQFNPTNPLANSAGSAPALVNNGNVTFNSDPSNPYAEFSGNGLLNTVSNLNLSSYTKVQISFSLEVTNSATGIVMELSPDYNGNNGGFVLATSANSSTSGVVDLNTNSTGSPTNGLDVSNFGHADGSLTPVFDNYVITYDPTQSNPNNVISVTRNGVADIQSITQSHPIPSDFQFANQVLYLGQRDGGIAPFTGNLANLVIQGFTPVPEPSSAVLGLIGVVGLVGWCGRRRRRSAKVA